MLDKLNKSRITAALKKIDAPFFRGDYNLNLVGVRSADTDSNAFNDALVVLYELDGKPVLHKFPMTTDSGVYYRENPVNVEGTAVLMPGFYRGCWSVGAHKGQYRALVQTGVMRVYRDADRDDEIDDPTLLQSDEGLFGINLHRAGANGYSLQVDKWSAGCQVVADPVDFDLVMAMVMKSASIYGPKFSYTLLTEDQL